MLRVVLGKTLWFEFVPHPLVTSLLNLHFSNETRLMQNSFPL